MTAPAASVRPWPAERWPTPDEWREWFLSLDAPAQYEAAERMLTAAQAAARCIDQDHDTAYDRGWHDALGELRGQLQEAWASEDEA